MLFQQSEYVATIFESWGADIVALYGSVDCKRGLYSFMTIAFLWPAVIMVLGVMLY